jgi:hypothetical protein
MHRDQFENFLVKKGFNRSTAKQVADATDFKTLKEIVKQNPENSLYTVKVTTPGKITKILDAELAKLFKTNRSALRALGMKTAHSLRPAVDINIDKKAMQCGFSKTLMDAWKEYEADRDARDPILFNLKARAMGAGALRREMVDIQALSDSSSFETFFKNMIAGALDLDPKEVREAYLEYKGSLPPINIKGEKGRGVSFTLAATDHVSEHIKQIRARIAPRKYHKGGLLKMTEDRTVTIDSGRDDGPDITGLARKTNKELRKLVKDLENARLDRCKALEGALLRNVSQNTRLDGLTQAIKRKNDAEAAIQGIIKAAFPGDYLEGKTFADVIRELGRLQGVEKDSVTSKDFVMELARSAGNLPEPGMYLGEPANLRPGKIERLPYCDCGAALPIKDSVLKGRSSFLAHNFCLHCGRRVN